jgi:hypothetical protein
MLMHYSSCSVWPGAVSIKSILGHITLNLCFLHPVGSVSHIVHLGASRRESDPTIFILGWDQYGFDKKRTGTCYTELMFLHLVESACHVVHFGASGV